MNSTSIKILLLALATCLISTVLPRPVQAQGGAGSKGGVVLACFTSDPVLFLVPLTGEAKEFQDKRIAASKKIPKERVDSDDPKARIFSWPQVAEDPTDARIGLASKAIVFDDVNRLKFVQVAEYYLATTDTSWGGSEDRFVSGAYHLHPLLYAINDLPVSRKAVPEPKFATLLTEAGGFAPFPMAKLDDPSTPLSLEERSALFNYIESEEARILKDREENNPVFAQVYGLVSNMFRGLPAFYTRLQAAHEKLGLIPDHPGKLSGSKSDQWDSRKLNALTNLPKPPENCLWMTAADRIPNTGEILYDRYLWQRMELFQRALLQLHEEIYYLGSDARGMGLFQSDVGPTRFLLSHFLRGERSKGDVSGEFVSTCAQYDASVNTQIPPVKFLESSACQIPDGAGRSSIKGADSTFLTTALLNPDPKTLDPKLLPDPKTLLDPKDPKKGLSAASLFLNQFLCGERFGCPDLMKTWEKVARYYGPYSSMALQALLTNDQSFFGRYSTIDRLAEKRDKASQTVTGMLAPYDTVYDYCLKGGYFSSDDTTGPQPAKNNVRRLERKEREKLEKKEENLDYSPRSDEPSIKKSDLEEIKFENAVFKDLKAKAGNNLELQVLNQNLGLLNDFPDKMLSDQISALLRLTAPESFSKVSDLEPGKGGSNIGAVGDVCGEVKERRKRLSAFVTKITGTLKDPVLTFYERPDDNPLDIKVPR